ncbi:MAG TPA: hypothetical protein VII86_02465, partial [Thermoanaerobaculia bacterium]
MSAIFLALVLAAVAPPDLSGLESAVAAQISEMRSLTAAQSSDPRAWGDLGQAYLAYGFNDAAADCFTKAAGLDPRDYRWPYLLGAAQQA